MGKLLHMTKLSDLPGQTPMKALDATAFWLVVDLSTIGW